LHSFLEVGKTQDLPSKFWQTLGDALSELYQIIGAELFFYFAYLFRSWQTQDLQSKIWQTIVDANTGASLRIYARAESVFPNLG
jgi:hypothetical protein